MPDWRLALAFAVGLLVEYQITGAIVAVLGLGWWSPLIDAAVGRLVALYTADEVLGLLGDGDG